MQALSVINTELVRTSCNKEPGIDAKMEYESEALEGARSTVSEHFRYSTGHSCVTAMSRIILFIFGTKCDFHG